MQFVALLISQIERVLSGLLNTRQLRILSAAKLLLRLGIPVLEERDRRDGIVQHRVDQEPAVAGDVVCGPGIAGRRSGVEKSATGAPGASVAPLP